MTFLGTSLWELKNKYTVNPPIIITAVTMGVGTVVSKQAGHNLIFFKYLLRDNIAICLTLTIFSFCLEKHRERKYQLLPLYSTYPFQPHMHQHTANILSTCRKADKISAWMKTNPTPNLFSSVPKAASLLLAVWNKCECQHWGQRTRYEGKRWDERR